MKYLYVYEYSRQLCSILGGGETGFKLYFSSEPELVYGDAFEHPVNNVIKPIARIPIEDLRDKKKELKEGLDE